MTAQTNNASSQFQPASASRTEHINLSRRYGAIGIQSVAAASRYADERKKPVPGEHMIDQRFVESAA